jgi:hypothetical protein
LAPNNTDPMHLPCSLYDFESCYQSEKASNASEHFANFTRDCCPLMPATNISKELMGTAAPSSAFDFCAESRRIRDQPKNVKNPKPPKNRTDLDLCAYVYNGPPCPDRVPKCRNQIAKDEDCKKFCYVRLDLDGIKAQPSFCPRVDFGNEKTMTYITVVSLVISVIGGIPLMFWVQGWACFSRSKVPDHGAYTNPDYG